MRGCFCETTNEVQDVLRLLYRSFDHLEELAQLEDRSYGIIYVSHLLPPETKLESEL